MSVLYSGLNQVIDFTWTLKFILFVLVSWSMGWFLTGRIKVPTQKVALSLVFGLHFVPVLAVLAIHLSVKSFFLTYLSCLLIGAGLFASRRSTAWKAPTRMEWQYVIGVVGSSLLFLAFLAWVGLVSHWDHLLAPTLYVFDYARSGDPFSEWIRTNVTGRWVLAQQTTAISLDAFEILWLGTFTSVLSKFVSFSLWLCAATFVRKPFHWLSLLFLGLLGIYVVEQAIQFRPHIYIGMLLVIYLQLRRNYPSALLCQMLLLLCIVLAKRDGLILAPLLAFFGMEKSLRWKLLLGGIPVLAMGASMSQIGGVSVGALLLNALGNTDAMVATLKQLLEHSFYLPLALCFVLYALNRKRSKQIARGWIIIALVSILIVLSNAILTGGQRYNFGTVERKIEYFLVPLIGLQSFIVLQPMVLKWTFKRKFQLNRRGANGALAALLAFVFVWPLYKKAANFSYAYHNTIAWTSTFLRSVSLYRSFFSADAALKVGFLFDNPDSFHLTPFQDLEAGKFPFLQAYVGEDLKVNENIDELKDRDVIFLSHEKDDASILEYQARTGFAPRFIHGGIKVLLSPKGLQHFDNILVMRLGDGSPVRHSFNEEWLSEDKIVWENKDVFRMYFTKWNPQNFEYKVVWPELKEWWTRAASFKFDNPPQNFVYGVYFWPHQMGDRLPTALEVDSERGKKKYLLSQLDLGGVYFLPVEATGQITIKMYSDEVPSPFWKAPYFTFFNLKALTRCSVSLCSSR